MLPNLFQSCCRWNTAIQENDKMKESLTENLQGIFKKAISEQPKEGEASS